MLSKGNVGVKKSSVFEWYIWFTEGEGMVKDTEKTRSSQKSQILRKCKPYSIRRPFKYPKSGLGKKFGQEADRQNLRDDLCTKKKFRQDGPQYP